MKSALFSERNYFSQKGFTADAKTFISLGKAAWDGILRHTLDFYAAPDPDEEGELVKRVSDELRAERRLVRAAFRFNEFFLNEFLSFGDAANDNPSDIVDDLRESLGLDDAVTEPLVRYFQALKEKAREGEIINAKRFTTRSCLPNLVSMTSVLDYRMVFKKLYFSDTSVDAYEPEFHEAVPLGIIELDFGQEETVKKIAFQADEQTIRNMINNLNALLKQLMVTRAFSNFEGEN